ncbi:hypothetical protein [Sinomonas flava]|uniref:hypothetical protein n=1 Tax=Sinomonas flava TaxID=496857 RepID=UPI0039A50618
MTDPYSTTPGTPPRPDSKPAAAKQEAEGVAAEAASSAGAVKDVAKQEATTVAKEAKYQAKDLIHQSRQELMDQAAQQQTRAAEGLRSIHRELSSMASNSEHEGVGTDLVRQAAEKSASFADWLDQRDPGSLLQEVKSYARRRPGAFLAIAAGAGLLAGRLSRSLAAGATDESSGAGQRQYPAGGQYPTGTQYPAGTEYPSGTEYGAGTEYAGGTQYGDGQYAAGQYGEGQYGDGQYAAGQYGGGQYAGGTAGMGTPAADLGQGAAYPAPETGAYGQGAAPSAYTPARGEDGALTNAVDEGGAYGQTPGQDAAYREYENEDGSGAGGVQGEVPPLDTERLRRERDDLR